MPGDTAVTSQVRGGDGDIVWARVRVAVAQSRIVERASNPERPEAREGLAAVVDRFPITGPPSEKFAVRYTLAHLRRLEPVGRSADLLCDSAKMEVYILRSLLPPIQPQLHPNRLPMRTVLFCVD